MIGKGLWKRTHKLSQTGSELDAIIEKADSLPEVSAADAGKRLTVTSDGKIDFVENFNIPVDPTTFTTTVTGEQLDAAVAAGKNITMTLGSAATILNLPVYEYASGKYMPVGFGLAMSTVYANGILWFTFSRPSGAPLLITINRIPFAT